MLDTRRQSHVQVAPFYSLRCAEWVPFAIRWVAETGLFERIESTKGFPDYGTALEASWFLARSLDQAVATTRL